DDGGVAGAVTVDGTDAARSVRAGSRGTASAAAGGHRRAKHSCRCGEHRDAGRRTGAHRAAVRARRRTRGAAAPARFPPRPSAMAAAAGTAGETAQAVSEPLSTLAARCRHQQDIRKSRFLAIAEPVTSTAQALAFLREVADPAATHNCWAWRMGRDYRFNDDGEPGGTAGRPILQAIEGQQMDGVMVVVTR